MHMRFSNKISKYSRISVPPLAGQKSPAEQLFVGGVFALSACYIGKAAGLLHCLRVSALFALRFFCLVYVRCFLMLRTWSPTWPPALSPAWPRSWSPAFTSGRHGLVYLAHIFRCESALLHARAWSAHTFGAKLPPPSTHSAALGRYASAFSTLHSRASVLETSAASTLHSRASALETSAASTLHSRASILEASSAPALPAPDVLIRTLAERAVWTS